MSWGHFRATCHSPGSAFAWFTTLCYVSRSSWEVAVRKRVVMRSGSVGLVVWLIFGVFSVAQAAPAIRIDDAVWDAGIIVSGKTYEKTLVIANAGNEPLIIETIEQCCGFFGEVKGGMRILPGETAPLQISIAPYQFVGGFSAEMFVVSNDPAQPRFSIFAAAQVVPSKHALGEIKVAEIDLGVIDVRDRVPFAITIASLGTIPLAVRQVDKSALVAETGYRPEIPAGGEATVTFEYIPRRTGPIDEVVSFVSNDTLNRVMRVRIRGYVTSKETSGRGLSIYPIAGQAVFDVIAKVYRYEFTIKNDGPTGVFIEQAESDLANVKLDYEKNVYPGKPVKFTATVPLSQVKNGLHHITLQVQLPFEFQ